MKKKEIIRHLTMLDYDRSEVRSIFPFRDNSPVSKLLSSTAEVVEFCQSYDQNANIYISVNQRNKVNSRKKDIDNKIDSLKRAPCSFDLKRKCHFVKDAKTCYIYTLIQKQMNYIMLVRPVVT